MTTKSLRRLRGLYKVVSIKNLTKSLRLLTLRRIAPTSLKKAGVTYKTPAFRGRFLATRSLRLLYIG